jgi:hypothetical protein
METETIIYLVAAALIFRVVVKLISRYLKDQKETSENND